MKNIYRIRRSLVVLLMVSLVVLLNACGGDGDDNDAPTPGAGTLALGSWSGDGVSFTLNEGSYWISDLSVTYSGSATGTLCRFNYTNTENIGAEIPVEVDTVTDTWTFIYDSPELTIEGVFTSETSAEVELTWSFYNDVCDAIATGNTVLYAYHTPTVLNIDGYLQYRTLSDAGNVYRGWLEFSRNGDPINESDISQIELSDSAGNPIQISRYTFYTDSTFWGEWNDTTSSVEFSGPYETSGFSIMFPDDTNLPADNYTYEAITSQGEVLFLTKYFPGETIMPIVDIASMRYDWFDNGDLRLEWSIPIGNYDEFRVVLMDQEWSDLLYVKLPANKDELIIPSEWIDQITDHKNPRLAIWEVQTRLYTNTGDRNNYARGYSDIVEIPWGVEVSDDHGDTPASATPLETDGTEVSGEIQDKPGGDLDYFSFDATSSETYSIETSDLEGGLDTVIVLYSTDGTTQIEVNDDGGVGLASKIEWTCQESGTYYVSVESYQGISTGSYNIAVNADGTTSPVAGEWSGTSGFGEIELVVASDSTEIESIAIIFIDFSCGGVTSNGTISQTGSWAVSNGQFTANIDWSTTSAHRSMEINGAFDDSGTTVSGTYEADYDGTICDGTWDASPE